MTTEDESPKIICANPDCRVAETRRCVEGLALDVCHHYGVETEARDDEAPVEDERVKSVTLPSGGALTPAEAAGVLRWGPARVVAVLGPSDSGKTSLIASLYDLFQEGAVDGIEFSRSRTLHAFEHTCHDARALSRRGVPHTNRTPRGEVSFYHLEVGGGAAGEQLVLLIGDRAGEEYREAADDVTGVSRFSEVMRADTLTVLVNGERLLGGGRHNLRSDIMMMLQGLRDGGGLRQGGRLALVLTKLDAVQAAAEAARALRDFELLLQDLQRLFGDVLTLIMPFQVAASPKNDTVPRGTGVGPLLSFWLGQVDAPTTVVRRRPAHARMFARLQAVEESREFQHG